MDFSTFVITGPSTVITQETLILNGQQSATAAGIYSSLNIDMPILLMNSKIYNFSFA
jgi:hypothetical protein